MISQRAVARRYGLDPATLNRFIKGVDHIKNPWAVSTIRLSKAFKMSIKRLSGLSPEEREQRFQELYGGQNLKSTE